MPQINPDGGQNVQYNFAPDICPQCHHAVNPSVLCSTLNGNPANGNTLLEIAFKCTQRNCQSMFIGQYKRNQVRPNTTEMIGTFNLKKAVPVKYLPPEIFPEVVGISPNFKTIFDQSCAAESFQLLEIAGVGFRKALEFLIKDYCIHKNSENEDEIKSSFLGVVINNHVEDANLKSCAQRAAWLGNDETHYVRKWDDKDINDLKTLIDLSCVWVRSNMLTEKYLNEMK